MELFHTVWQNLKQFPEYIPGVLAALTVLALGLPLYFGMWYILRRRNLYFPWRLRIASVGSFILFSALAFIFSSPLERIMPGVLINTFLLLACLVLAYTAVPLIDVFLIDYYLVGVRRVYISPPLRKVISFVVFFISFLPIMRYMLRFNPFALIAIPTIATAGLALALQDTLKSFIAGVGLGQLVHVGDWIAYQSQEGRVLDVNWTRTVVRTMQGDHLFIPNTLLLAHPFTNYSTHRSHRFTLKVGVAYTASPEQVKQVLERCAQNLPEIVDSPKPIAQVLSLEEASIHYALFYWVDDYGKHYDVQDKLATRVWEAFRKEGFEVPFPFPTFPMQEGFHAVTRTEATAQK